jgi:hypothetical protein
LGVETPKFGIVLTHPLKIRRPKKTSELRTNSGTESDLTDFKLCHSWSLRKTNVDINFYGLEYALNSLDTSSSETNMNRMHVFVFVSVICIVSKNRYHSKICVWSPMPPTEKFDPVSLCTLHFFGWEKSKMAKKCEVVF